jgi:ubiquinone/menaquinone biosynthesis C-methylase UbiE
MNTRNTACNLCGKKSAVIIERDGEFSVVRCLGCGLVYVTPQPKADELRCHYGKDYYAPWTGAQRERRVRMWAQRLKRLRVLVRPGRLLDVGCGSGLFLHQAQNYGWQVWGTEVSSFSVQRIQEEFNIKVIHGELKDAHFADDFFDCITFWHVLEHTSNPFENLCEAARILKPGGYIVIAVPNINNYLIRLAYLLFKRRKFRLFSAQDREVHLYHFSHLTIKKLMEKAGIRPVRFDVDTGSVRIGEQFLDMISWALYKLTHTNIGRALEACGIKEA